MNVVMSLPFGPCITSEGLKLKWVVQNSKDLAKSVTQQPKWPSLKTSAGPGEEWFGQIGKFKDGFSFGFY